MSTRSDLAHAAQVRSFEKITSILILEWRRLAFSRAVHNILRFFFVFFVFFCGGNLVTVTVLI